MDNKIILEVMSHYQMWNEDNQKRMTRKGGWNDVTDAYFGRLPSDWPFTSRVTDPRIRTSLIEKNARLLNAKLQGRLAPREGSDMVGAILHNALLDYQWDNANDGGSMMTKFDISDMDTRLYGTKYAFVYWKYETNKEGEIVFDGNELMPLDIRDCGIDPVASNIKDAKWFQIRSWIPFEELEAAVDTEGKSLYKGLSKIKTRLTQKVGRSSQRTTSYTPRMKQLLTLEDRTGQDIAFPVVLIVNEYRDDKWVTFSPEDNVIIRDIDNPYEHGRKPIAQLKYYKLSDEPNGESEVEPVLGIWRAIQAVLCAYLDEVVLKIRPPLKVIENAARVETIVYGPEAQWLVDRQDAIMEMKSSGDTLAYFQTTYQALTAAFNIAMGDISQGTSNVDAFQTDAKTATEIKASLKQQNARDQKNQNDLGEFIKDVMGIWMENNKQFLFANAKKTGYIVRIVGKNNYARLKQLGLDDTQSSDEAMQTIADIIQQNPELTPAQIQQLHDATQLPKFPIIQNPSEKEPEKLRLEPKMTISDVGDVADVAILPEDLNGTFDYIPDVKSMSVGTADEQQKARQDILTMALNPTVMQALAQQGEEIDLKQLLIENFEGSGYKEAETLFKPMQQMQAPPQMGAPASPGQAGGEVVPPQGVPVPPVAPNGIIS